MALDITALTAAVTKLASVDTSVVALLGTLTQEVKDLAAQADPAMQAKLNDLAAKVDGAATDIANAVLANTPATP